MPTVLAHCIVAALASGSFPVSTSGLRVFCVVGSSIMATFLPEAVELATGTSLFGRAVALMIA